MILVPKEAPWSVAYKVRRQFRGENGLEVFGRCDWLPRLKRFFAWKVNFAAAVKVALQQKKDSMKIAVFSAQLPLAADSVPSVCGMKPFAAIDCFSALRESRFERQKIASGGQKEDAPRREGEEGKRRILEGRICKCSKNARFARTVCTFLPERSEPRHSAEGGCGARFLLDRTISVSRTSKKDLHEKGCRNQLMRLASFST